MLESRGTDRRVPASSAAAQLRTETFFGEGYDQPASLRAPAAGPAARADHRSSRRGGEPERAERCAGSLRRTRRAAKAARAQQRLRPPCKGRAAMRSAMGHASTPKRSPKSRSFRPPSRRRAGRPTGARPRRQADRSRPCCSPPSSAGLLAAAAVLLLGRYLDAPARRARRTSRRRSRRCRARSRR